MLSLNECNIKYKCVYFFINFVYFWFLFQFHPNLSLICHPYFYIFQSLVYTWKVFNQCFNTSTWIRVAVVLIFNDNFITNQDLKSIVLKLLITKLIRLQMYKVFKFVTKYWLFVYSSYLISNTSILIVLRKIKII